MFRRARQEREMADELQFHLDARVDAWMSRGLTRDEAIRRARLEFGAVEAYKDRCREERGWRIGDELRADARYAVRMLRKNPVFALVAIATLAIGIGVNAAIFSIVNGVLLRPLPYPEPDRLMMIHEASEAAGSGDFSAVSYVNYLDWHAAAQSFTGMAAFASTDASATLSNGEAEHVRVLWAAADLLPVLRVTPIRGRAITTEEDQLHGTPVAVIGYALWQQHYGGREDVLGQRIKIESDTFTIVGVTPPGFSLRDTDLILPIAQRDNPVMKSREMHPGIRVVGRLRPGLTLDQAQTEMKGIAAGLAMRYPKTNKGWTVNMRPMLDSMIGDIRPTLYLLLGAVGLVLLIACANVANLLLARAEGRRREFAVRTALGAGMPRLIRQLLAESTLLSVIGGVCGLLLASAATRALLQRLPVAIPRAADVGVDWRVVAFTFLASLVTGILFGLAPALQGTRVDVQDALKSSSRSVASSQGPLRGLLVVVQLALGLVLLVSTGLLLRTLWQMSRVDPGIELHQVTTMRVGLPALAAAPPERILAWFHETEDRLGQVPGIAAASFTDMLPLSGNDEEVQYWKDGPMPSNSPLTLLFLTTPRHFDVFKIPIHAGRGFRWEDANRSPIPVVVDDVLAHKMFGNENPLGQTLNVQIIGKCEIVGVAGHVKHWGIGADDTETVREQIYLPFSHIPAPFMKVLASVGESLSIRSSLPPAQVMETVKGIVRGAGGAQPVYSLQTMEEVAAEQTARHRFLAIVLGLFAVIALVLAGIGLYGVMAYSVSQRVREFGIRLALGASARQIIDQVLRQGIRLVLIGIAAGVVVAVLATRFLESLLFRVTATDPLTFAAVAVLLAAVALLACLVPALRAVRIEPTVALRQE